MFFSAKQPAVSTDTTKVDALLSRGVENVIPKELGRKKLTSGERLRIYLGIDPTGARLHLGHSVPLRKLKEFSELGHEVIFLVGSFTAMIGDPSGRDALREPLTKEAVEKNFKDYKRQAEKILDFSKVQVCYNHEWLEKLKMDDVVKLASHFTVQQLLQRDMFEKRIKEGKPIALHEFLYPLMVGYDSVVLDVDCELGGSDQEFNILAGRHLQTVLGKRDKFVLTTRLIEGTDGRKMSKSYDNCVYLDEEPGDMYGKLMSIRDELVPTYFDVLTDMSGDEVKAHLAKHPKEAKMALAKEIVRMYHGEKAAEKAADNFENIFSKRQITEEDSKPALFNEGQTYLDALVYSQFVVSRTEARRLAADNAISSITRAVLITDLNAQPIDGELVKIGKHRIAKMVLNK